MFVPFGGATSLVITNLPELSDCLKFDAMTPLPVYANASEIIEITITKFQIITNNQIPITK
jgi:hypothetical protein